MDKFKPHASQPTGMKSLFVTVEPALHERIKLAAARARIPMKVLVLQALRYALDNMETDGNDG